MNLKANRGRKREVEGEKEWEGGRERGKERL